MKVYTHLNMDLDNASTTALALLYFSLTPKDVIFVGADYDGVGMGPNDIALDIDVGLKGEKYKDISTGEYRIGSAFKYFVETYLTCDESSPYERLIEFVDAEDSTADWRNAYPTIKSLIEKNGILTLLDTFYSLKSYYKNDYKLLEAWVPIIAGFKARQDDALQAIIEVKGAKWDKDVAVTNAKSPIATAILFDRGARFVIYERGNTMGIRRRADVSVNLGKVLKKHLPTWFHHEAGFLSCWGSTKAPKSTPPDVTTDHLLSLLRVGLPRL